MNNKYQLMVAEKKNSSPNHAITSSAPILTDQIGIKSDSQSASVGKDSSNLPAAFGPTVTGNEIKENDIHGDVHLGVQYNFNAPIKNPNALMALIERSRQLSKESNEYRDMFEELQSFLEPRPGRNIIGLAAKLTAGNREDLLEDASWYENKFVRRLAREQHCQSFQALFLHCLSQINSAFCAHIRPLIQSNSSTIAVDAAIKTHVIDPLYHELMYVDSALSSDVIRGMLYFLTGKCHIQWK